MLYLGAVALGAEGPQGEPVLALSAEASHEAAWKILHPSLGTRTEEGALVLEPVPEKGKGPATQLAGKNYYYPYYLGLLFNGQFPSKIPAIALDSKEVGEGLLLNGGWIAAAAAGEQKQAFQSLAGIYPDGTAAWNEKWPVPERKDLGAKGAWIFPAEGKYDERLVGLAVQAGEQEKKAVSWMPVLLPAGKKARDAGASDGKFLTVYQTRENGAPPQAAKSEELLPLAGRLKKSQQRLQAWEKNSHGAWDDELLDAAQDTANLARLAVESGMLAEAGQMLDRLDLALGLIEGTDSQAAPLSWDALRGRVREAFQTLDKTYPDESKNGRDEAGYLKHYAAVDRYWDLHGELSGLNLMVSKSAEEPASMDPEVDANRRRCIDFRLRQVAAFIALPSPGRLEGRVPVRSENAALLRELSKLAVWDSAEGLFYAVLNDPRRHDVLRYDPNFHFVVNNTNLIKNGDFAFQLLTNDLRRREENNREQAGFVPGNAFRPPEDFALVRDYEGKRSPINPVLAIHFLVRQELLRFKYEKLQPSFDPVSMKWSYGRADSLASRLALSSVQAAEAYEAVRQNRELAAAASLPELYLRRGLLEMQARGASTQLDGLGDLWKSTLLSRTLLALNRPIELPLPSKSLVLLDPPADSGKEKEEQAVPEKTETASTPPAEEHVAGEVPALPEGALQAQTYARPPKAIPVAMPVDDADLP